MDKIKKMWVETHTKKNGKTYFTGHMKRRWGIINYEQWISKWHDNSYFMSGSEYYSAYEFDSKELAILHLQKLKNDEIVNNIKENEELIVSVKKEYVT